MTVGFKVRRLVTKNEYTIEKLYDAIRDKEFTAGQPVLTRNGEASMITFSRDDNNGEIMVSPGQMKKPPYTRFTVARNVTESHETDVRQESGSHKASSVQGKTALAAEKLVVITQEELQALGL